MTVPGVAGFEVDLLALDIDDTLTTFLGSIDEPVVDAIGRAREAGITVVLATGRSLSTTAPIARAAGMDGWVVCSNGAVLATVEPETIIETIWGACLGLGGCPARAARAVGSPRRRPRDLAQEIPTRAIFRSSRAVNAL